MNAQNAARHTIPSSGYIRRFRLAKLLDISLSTLDRLVKDGAIPKPVKLGEKTTVFDAAEITEWLAERRREVV